MKERKLTVIDTDKYENITPERWAVDEEEPFRVVDVQDCTIARTDFVNIEEEREWQLANAQLIADAPLLLAEVKRLQSEPTVTVDDYHKKGELYVTVHFPDGEQYVGLVEKWEGEEE